MKTFLSPLRYPGGKGVLGNFLANTIILNGLHGGEYWELYAGGSGAALYLLFNDIVDRIMINDADRYIYAFWYAILNHPEKFIRRLENIDVSIQEFNRQRDIQANTDNDDLFEMGFSTFYLNRTSRSGILLKAGPIGGFDQKGNYLIDARFNKNNLISRIENIANKSDKIRLYNRTAESILLENGIPENTFCYLDPPYYNKGRELYLNNYSHDQHENLSNIMRNIPDRNWLISYDNTKEINDMYLDFRKFTFGLNYSLQNKKEGSELMIISNNIRTPETMKLKNKIHFPICVE